MGAGCSSMDRDRRQAELEQGLLVAGYQLAQLSSDRRSEREPTALR
jgi:hypothetical protein